MSSNEKEDRRKKWYDRLFKEEKVEYNTSKFNDPIAQSTEWTPASPGGANFKTRKLKQISPHRIQFKPGFTSRTFGCFFIAIGFIFFLAFGVISYLQDLKSIPFILASLGGLFFMIIGIAMGRRMTIPIVFDKTSGYYYKSRKDPNTYINIQDVPYLKKLDDIHAIQILPEFVRSSGNSGSFYSYELNLVFKDSSRVNVVDHGQINRLLKDAEILAKFLRVPIWDALDMDD